uniref:Uncharacterized protein n=1 Tax=Parastrongyloides trichosuri TaxID=131310 RepID=A0A0N4ZX72_PARTI
MLPDSRSRLLLTAAASLAVGFFIYSRSSNIFKSLNKPTSLKKTIDEECGEISTCSSISTDNTLKTLTPERASQSLKIRSAKLREERDRDLAKIDKIRASSTENS